MFRMSVCNIIVNGRFACCRVSLYFTDWHSDTDRNDCECRQYVWDQCPLDTLQHFRKSVSSWSTREIPLLHSLRCLRCLFRVFEMFEKFVLCRWLWPVWEVWSVSLRCKKFVLCFRDVFLRLKNLKRHIETLRHCGRKDQQGQRRKRLIRKTCRQTATSDSAEFDA